MLDGLIKWTLSWASHLPVLVFAKDPVESFEKSREMEIIKIDRRSSGHAFEVILKGPNPNGSPAPKLKSPKMAISKDTIMLKLNAAEERRKSQEADVLKHFVEKRKHELEVTEKAQQNKKVCMKNAEERLHNMVETNKNREAKLAATVKRMHDQVKHAKEVCQSQKTKNT